MVRYPHTEFEEHIEEEEMLINLPIHAFNVMLFVILYIYPIYLKYRIKKNHFNSFCLYFERFIKLIEIRSELYNSRLKCSPWFII